MIGVAEQCRRALQACVSGQRRGNSPQRSRQYLRENPNRWGERGNSILYNVLFSHCLRQQFLPRR